MKNTPWKWLVAANCLMAASASYAAGHSGHAHTVQRAIMHHSDKAAINGFHRDPSKFTYMDSAPLHNSNHIRIAVMVFKKPASKPSQCATLKGDARYNCFAATMPT